MIGTLHDIFNWLFEQDKDKIFEIKEYKAKRSLNANAYAWVLIGKIADVLRTSKEEVYIEELKKYGQITVVSVKSVVDIKGFFKYYEKLGESDLKGVPFTHYKVYKGSSEFDTKEMSIFIDGIISDAKDLEIETLTPDELTKLKSLWE